MGGEVDHNRAMRNLDDLSWGQCPSSVLFNTVFRPSFEEEPDQAFRLE